MIPQTMTLPQARMAFARFREEFGRSASPDELVAYVAIKESEEKERFVRVQFVGNSQRYCYEILPGPVINIGDYLQVWSPRTQRKELVRVAEHGRGPWVGPTKIAHRVQWQELD